MFESLYECDSEHLPAAADSPAGYPVCYVTCVSLETKPIRAHICLQTAIHVCYGMDSSPNRLPVGLQAPHCNMFLISAESFVGLCCVLLCLSESVVLTLCFYIHVCLMCYFFLGQKRVTMLFSKCSSFLDSSVGGYNFMGNIFAQFPMCHKLSFFPFVLPLFFLSFFVLVMCLRK